MFHIATTRFNNTTYAENMAYRQKVLEPVLYGVSKNIPLDVPCLYLR